MDQTSQCLFACKKYLGNMWKSYPSMQTLKEKVNRSCDNTEKNAIKSQWV